MNLWIPDVELYDSGKKIYQELCQLIISILGDFCVPLPEVLYLVEKIIKKQIINYVIKAEFISNYRNSKFIDIEDFIFIFRHDMIKLKRIYDFLTFEKGSKNLESHKNEDFHINNEHKQVKNKRNIKSFFKNLGHISECLIERISKNDPIIIDKAKIDYLKKVDQNYRSLSDQQYVDMIVMRQNSFKNLSFKKYLKLKTIFLIDLKHKPMTDQCGEVIGFLFRELLNEIVDKLMLLKQKHGESSVEKKHFDIASSQVFDAFRLASNDNLTFVNKSSISKKYSFFK